MSESGQAISLSDAPNNPLPIRLRAEQGQISTSKK
jgi:hypothetical protein